ncbi:activating transcription factor of chaperone-like [Ornithodoros turicata]|uniref:activating transcription factor of chaperone-like n=1 Tax=Ornithodoros turicata TaxID=34597 RepID=UPI0031394CFB
MESHWDLESVLEQCCSKFSNEDLLPPLTNAGDFGWLDEKVDLSTWTELDFPDELAAGMPEGGPLSVHGSPFYEPKLQSQLLPSPSSQSPSWPSDPVSPTFPSPPVSPLNSSPFVAPARSQLAELQLSFEDAYYDPFALDCSSLPPSPVASVSPPQTPDVSRRSPVLASRVTSPTVFLYEPVSPPHVSAPPSPVQQSPQSEASSYSSADASLSHNVSLSTVCQQPIYLAPVENIVVVPQLLIEPVAESSPRHEPAEVTGDVDVAAEEDDSAEEYMVIADDAEVPPQDEPPVEVAVVATTKAPSTQKRKKRGGRKVAKESVRKERKRLQNKDAATRYRQRKKQQVEGTSQEYTEQYEESCKLKAEVLRISNEISYLKGLMRELFKAKGLLK